MRPEPSPFPVLVTERLRLRALCPDDATGVLRMRSDPRVMHFIPKPLFFKHAEAEEMLRDFQRAQDAREALMWGITLASGDALCGLIGYWRILWDHQRAEVGYFLDPALWGLGLMTEALGAVLRHGFGPMALHSVEAATDPANAGSIRVLERNGFIREGFFRQNIRVQGEFRDTATFSRLAP